LNDIVVGDAAGAADFRAARGVEDSRGHLLTGPADESGILGPAEILCQTLGTR
jgi:hypothetical protein